MIPDGLNGGESLSPLTVADARPVPTRPVYAEPALDLADEVLETRPS